MSNRNFNTISPSARSILLLKGHTHIPFARETAELISYPDKFTPDNDNNDMVFWGRVLHFENRYLGVDQLLEDIEIKNILELSSGFSFRGLDKTMQKDYHYIDTDLPDLITEKKEFAEKLKSDKKSLGTLELLPLNALDEEQFHQVVNHFPEGEIVIVNEGLLMYLDKSEKEKLCGIIHRILKERGGYWITGDIYIKSDLAKFSMNLDNKTKEFLERHKVEENKFDSFADAKEFFENNGFVIDKEENLDIAKLSSMQHFLKLMKEKNIPQPEKPGKIQTAWRLKVAKV